MPHPQSDKLLRMIPASQAAPSSISLLGTLCLQSGYYLLIDIYKPYLKTLLQRGSDLIELTARYEEKIKVSSLTVSRGQLLQAGVFNDFDVLL